MAEKTKYFDRMVPIHSWNRLLSNDGGKYSPSIRKLRQHYLHDSKFFSGKVFSATTQPPASGSHHQSPIDLIASPLKCDDCQKHNGLFQCCHCNQRLCIRCCNKHYKKITIELERLHELSDHLVTKIIQTKDDLERQKNETLEQCHQWRIDTINTINKAHALIIQTIHDEYEIIGNEYELFVEKEMSHINIDKNELIRMKKGNLGSLLSSASTSAVDSNNSIDTIKICLETFAKHIDETGKISFQVKLPTFDIDDNLTVESRFGDITRSTSATWKNEDSMTEETSERESPPVFQTTSPSSLEDEVTHSSEKDSEIQPSFQTDNYASGYGTASASSSSPLHNEYEHHSSTLSSHEPAKDHFNSFYNNRRHTHPFPRTSSTSPQPPIYKANNENEDTYQSVQHVQLKYEQGRSLEGVAVQIEQSEKNDGNIAQRRTCMQVCGVRRQTTALTSPSPSLLHTDSLTNDQSWHYYRTNSIPSFIQ